MFAEGSDTKDREKERTNGNWEAQPDEGKRTTKTVYTDVISTNKKSDITRYSPVVIKK